MDYKEYAKELVSMREDIIAAYGYGSAFSHQSGYTEETRKSLDMIFVVDDIKKWNKNNFKLHSRDYTKYTKAIFKIAPKSFLTGSTSVIYNIVVNRYEQDFKYGLIEKERLLYDLKTWKHFYVCGRMQKPTYIIKSNDELDRAIELNRKQALLAALLILGADVVKVDELLETICRLSYDGDVRTVFHAENPNKVKNIVKGSYEELFNMYCINEYLEVRGQHAFVNIYQVYADMYDLPEAILNNKIISINGRNILEIMRKKNLKESIAHPVKQFLVSGFSTSKHYMSEKAKKKKLK